jgi:RNA polymerase sigma factor (sigma-70 family)
MHLESDIYYIEAVLDGNVESFSVLIRKYQDFVYHIAYKIVKNQFDAEEVAQDTFMKAYKNLQSFSKESKFSSWLYKIAYYTAISKTRNKFNQLHHVALDQQVDAATLNDKGSALELLKTEEQKKYINAAMERLPDNIQLVLSLFYLKECTLKEIADITDNTISNIKTLLHRGRKKLLISLDQLLKDELKSIV